MTRWALLLVAGCGAHDFTQMVTLGPTFGSERQGIVLAFEVAPVFHTPFPPPPPPDIGYEPQRSVTAIGIAPNAAIGVDWHTHLGFSSFVAVGADFMPWLFENGTAVGFGGQVAYARGGYAGLYFVAPRLWFTTPVADLAGKPLSLGLMLRGQFNFGSGTDGLGPAIVLRR